MLDDQNLVFFFNDMDCNNVFFMIGIYLVVDLGYEDDDIIVCEFDIKWIFNLSMYFCDCLKCEKFFVMYWQEFYIWC